MINYTDLVFSTTIHWTIFTILIVKNNELAHVPTGTCIIDKRNGKGGNTRDNGII